MVLKKTFYKISVNNQQTFSHPLRHNSFTETAFLTRDPANRLHNFDCVAFFAIVIKLLKGVTYDAFKKIIFILKY